MDTYRIDDANIPDLRPWPLGRERWRATAPQTMTPITLSTPLRALIAFSCVLAPLLYAAALFLASQEWVPVDSRPPSAWFVCLVVVSVSALWLAPRASVSRWVRAACLVPILHIGLMGLVWWLWRGLSGLVDPALALLPMVSEFPAPGYAIGAGALVVLVSLLPSGRRRRARVPGWLRAVVAFALAHVLILGLWLPIAAAGWDHLFATQAMDGRWTRIGDPDTSAFLWIAMAPPTILALGFAGLITLRPELVARYRGQLAFVGAWMLFVALITRLTTTFAGYVAYANMVHVLFAGAAFALLSVSALGLCHARVLYRARRDADRDAPWVQDGIVEVEPGRAEVVGWLEERGWLGGLVSRMAPFSLRTERGLLEVPGSTLLIAPMPAVADHESVEDGSVRADAVPVLRAGDRVTVSGYVAPPSDGAAYRSSHLPIPGMLGMVATRPRGPGESVLRDVCRIMWRPCALYIKVVMVAALPGVAAFLRFL